ncbi:hypothetical protein SUZIE_135425 [Sciurus carolinensis]|uniref:Uncharacterized protein n=1 Tax=Sciurus carolinensis TaxID=30640 RepID=A0AA41MPT2_SCICA|nr:hypothetical protein [Sciurus carolinensis]
MGTASQAAGIAAMELPGAAEGQAAPPLPPRLPVAPVLPDGRAGTRASAPASQRTAPTSALRSLPGQQTRACPPAPANYPRIGCRSLNEGCRVKLSGTIMYTEPGYFCHFHNVIQESSYFFLLW